MEIWKDYIKLPKVILQVSSFGRVRSISKKGKVKFLKLYNRGGKRQQYLNFGYKLNGVKKCQTVHRAVAELFIPKPSEFYEVDHIDNDPSNNNVSNLQWLTPCENGIKADSIVLMS